MSVGRNHVQSNFRWSNKCLVLISLKQTQRKWCILHALIIDKDSLTKDKMNIQVDLKHLHPHTHNALTTQIIMHTLRLCHYNGDIHCHLWRAHNWLCFCVCVYTFHFILFNIQQFIVPSHSGCAIASSALENLSAHCHCCRLCVYTFCLPKISRREHSMNKEITMNMAHTK